MASAWFHIDVNSLSDRIETALLLVERARQRPWGTTVGKNLDSVWEELAGAKDLIRAADDFAGPMVLPINESLSLHGKER